MAFIASERMNGLGKNFDCGINGLPEEIKAPLNDLEAPTGDGTLWRTWRRNGDEEEHTSSHVTLATSYSYAGSTCPSHSLSLALHCPVPVPNFHNNTSNGHRALDVGFDFSVNRPKHSNATSADVGVTRASHIDNRRRSCVDPSPIAWTLLYA